MADEGSGNGPRKPEADRLHERAGRLRDLSAKDLMLLADGIVAHAAERFMLEGRRSVGRTAEKSRGAILRAVEEDMRERAGGLVYDFVNRFPDGSADPSTYGDIEDALDRIDAPSVDGSRWLTLPQRIAALGRERGPAEPGVEG